MESGDVTSSDSSASDFKPRPVGGALENESAGMIYCPPHFPQRQRSRSGSNFSPHSEETSEDDSSSSKEEDRGHPVAPPISIRTYAPPPTINNTSDHDSVSDMESGHTTKSHHVSIPYQSSRHRQVNYKEFYSGSEEENVCSDSEEEVGQKRGTTRKVSSN